MDRDELMAILEDEECLVADGLEDALIGYVTGAGMATRALYDEEKCIEVLMRQGMTEEEAIEYFGFNVIGAYLGEETPAFATLLREEESDVGDTAESETLGQEESEDGGGRALHRDGDEAEEAPVREGAPGEEPPPQEGH